MKVPRSTRFDPSGLSASDRGALNRIQILLHEEKHPYLVSKSGDKIQIPDAVYNLLVKLVSQMRAGEPVVLMPENREITTQAAANLLGVSRPFFVQLLEEGGMPFHYVGTHRRVKLKDVIEYATKRNAERTKALDELTEEIEGAGLYGRAPK